MILDLYNLDCDRLQGDVCIVGSGVAGIALASRLARAGRRIIVAESGGLDHEQDTQMLYDSVVEGKRFGSALNGRNRVHGGSSTTWGGQALPFSPIDFERREWVAHSGWPISFDELNAYYSHAARFMQLDARGFDAELFSYLARRPGTFDPELIHDHFSKWSPVPDLRPRYRSWFERSDSVQLVLHANLVDLRFTSGGDRIEQAHFRSLTGKTLTVAAQIFVLCLGGIESARVLLATRTQQPCGIGNARDLVGRYFQDHPTTDIGVVQPKRAVEFQCLTNVSEKAGLRYSYRMSAAQSLQRTKRILNVSAFYSFPSSEALQNLKTAYRLGRRRQLAQAVPHLVAALRNPLQVMTPLYHFLAHRRVVTPGSRFPLRVMMEQEPNWQSRLTLSTELDALGMPKTKIQWRLTALSLVTLQVYARVLKSQLESCGHGQLDLAPWLDAPDTDWPEQLSDMNHHMGSTRMANSPAEGVVDSQLKVFDTDNLYIASSSVFPTGGHSNPTFTLLALCFRLAEQIEKSLHIPS